MPLDDISSTPVVMRKNIGLEGTGHGKATCYNEKEDMAMLKIGHTFVHRTEVSRTREIERDRIDLGGGGRSCVRVVGLEGTGGGVFSWF